MKKIVIVLINYFKEHELLVFVKEFVLSQDYENFEVVIVDNGSETDLLRSELSANPLISIINPGSNTGYFGAARLAFDMISKRDGGIPEIFIVSNFDLEFDKNSFFREINEVCLESKSAVIGPRIVSGLNKSELNPMYTSRLQLSHLRRLSFITSYYLLFVAYQYLHYLKRKLRSEKSMVAKSSIEVYAIHGSMMIFKTSFFQKGGSLIYPSFLYQEELFVAEQCRNLNLKMEVNSKLQVVHAEHTTTGKFKSVQHMKWLHQSVEFILKEFYHG
jgi:GT2 family glycosyltransferase